RAGNASFSGSAPGIYPTTDGHVAIAAAASNAVWARFCGVIGRHDLIRAPGFATLAPRRDRRDEIAAIIQEWTAPRAKADVVRALATAGVPAAPVNNVAEMVADPQVRAREMFVEAGPPIYAPFTSTGTPLNL